MSTKVTPMPWSLKIDLADKGWAHGPREIRRVVEWSVHDVVSEILTRKVPVTDEHGKAFPPRPVTGGELLDAITGISRDLPGQSPQQLNTNCVVKRPESRAAKSGNGQTSSLKPARSRLSRLLAVCGIYNAHNLNRAWAWAMQRGFRRFVDLPAENRAEILNGKSVHANSVVNKPAKSTTATAAVTPKLVQV